MNPAFENSELGVGNTNYFDLHYKDWAFKQNHNLSLSGGGKKGTILYFWWLLLRKMVFSVMPIWISAVIILPLIFLLRYRLDEGKSKYEVYASDEDTPLVTEA